MSDSNESSNKNSVKFHQYSNYSNVTRVLKNENILVDASEIQGMLCGMLAGGMNIDDKQWLSALSDMVNESVEFSTKVSDILIGMYNQICQEFIEADFALQICLPEDSNALNERGTALIHWVQGFLLGFGLHQNDLSKCSAEVKEALEDFSQIAKMDESMEEDEESEQAFLEVLEYVRIGAMLCFNELGKSIIDSKQQSPKLH